MIFSFSAFRSAWCSRSTVRVKVPILSGTASVCAGPLWPERNSNLTTAPSEAAATTATTPRPSQSRWSLLRPRRRPVWRLVAAACLAAARWNSASRSPNRPVYSSSASSRQKSSYDSRSPLVGLGRPGTSGRRAVQAVAGPHVGGPGAGAARGRRRRGGLNRPSRRGRDIGSNGSRRERAAVPQGVHPGTAGRGEQADRGHRGTEEAAGPGRRTGRSRRPGRALRGLGTASGRAAGVQLRMLGPVRAIPAGLAVAGGAVGGLRIAAGRRAEGGTGGIHPALGAADRAAGHGRVLRVRRGAAAQFPVPGLVVERVGGRIRLAVGARRGEAPGVVVAQLAVGHALQPRVRRPGRPRVLESPVVQARVAVPLLRVAGLARPRGAAAAVRGRPRARVGECLLGSGHRPDVTA